MQHVSCVASQSFTQLIFIYTQYDDHTAETLSWPSVTFLASGLKRSLPICPLSSTTRVAFQGLVASLVASSNTALIPCKPQHELTRQLHSQQR